MKKTIKYIILVLALILVIYFVYNYSKPKPKTQNNKKLDTISNYNYLLSKTNTEEYKQVFYELKENLESKAIDEKKYAEEISKLFVIDFYTLENKKSNNDIGGLQFIYKESQEKFIVDAKNTIYKYVKNNIYNNRNQELPYVTEVTIEGIKNDSVNYLNKTDLHAYNIECQIKYKKQLGYPEQVHITIIKEDNILSIIDIK